MRNKNIAGIVFVLGNLLGVVPIAGQAGVYRPDRYQEWLEAIHQAPVAHTISSLLFLIGALAGVRLGIDLYQKGYRNVGFLLGLGGASNAAWLPAPLVIAQLRLQAGAFGLAMSLFADSIFNGVLGVAMIILGRKLLREGRKKLGISGILIGLINSIVFTQFWWEGGAKLLGIIGPFWLGWWLVWSLRSNADKE